MKPRNAKQVVLPLIAAFIFGSTFVAQSLSANVVGFFTFGYARSIVAVAGLSIIIAVMDRRQSAPQQSVPERKKQHALLLKVGLLAGTLIAAANSMQQYALRTTTAAKAGFITTLYIVIVPLLGVMLGKRVRPLLWVGVASALGGLYFLCFHGGGGFHLVRADALLLLSSLCFSVHIHVVDSFADRLDMLRLCRMQAAVMGLESFIGAMIIDGFQYEQIAQCLPYIIYAGFFSAAIANLLQLLAQKDGDPTVVSLMLSMEALFAAICGAIVLHEHLNGREYIGCALMLLAIVLVQLPEKKSASVRD